MIYFKMYTVFGSFRINRYAVKVSVTLSYPEPRATADLIGQRVL